MTGFYVATTYQTKIVTQTERTTAILTTTATVTVPPEATQTVLVPLPGVAEYVYPSSNLTSSISGTVGETFIIQLSSNAGSTGYDWKVSTSTGIQYLNYTVVSTSTLAGGPQVRNYFFRAVQAGSETIALQNERLFAPYTIAATINVEVAVSPANQRMALTMLSYNFQANDTSGSLFVVFKNYGNMAINISNVYFDHTLVNDSSLAFGAQTRNTCGSLMECELTLYDGHNALALPSKGDHVLMISTSEGDSQYVVSPGVIYSAECTYTESC